MPKVTTTQTVTETVTIAPKVQRALLAELQGYQALAAEQKVYKQGMDEHRVNILDIGERELDPSQYKFEIEGFKVALVVDGKDSRLDKVKLTKLLVAGGHYSVAEVEKLFQKATTVKPKKSYAKITVPGGQDDD